MVTENEVQLMDTDANGADALFGGSLLGDADDFALPELPDSVWMRMLANALDPDAPPAGLDLIPVDLPAGADEGYLDEQWVADDPADTGVLDTDSADSDDSDDSDGSDSVAAGHAHDGLGEHGGPADHEVHGWHDPAGDTPGWGHDTTGFDHQPWGDPADDPFSAGA